MSSSWRSEPFSRVAADRMDTLVQVAIVLWLPVLYIFIVLYCSYRLFYPTLRKLLCPPQINDDFVGSPEDPETLACRHARAIRTYRRLLRVREFRLRYSTDFDGGLATYPALQFPSDLQLNCPLPHLHVPPPYSPERSDPIGTPDGSLPVYQSETQAPPPRYEDLEPPSYAEIIKNPN